MLLCFAAAASPVSESAAKALAEKFLQRPSQARLGMKGQVPSQTVGKKRMALKASAASSPAYYVFNFDGGGWVIVSGEDGVEPVLGYSTTGSFTLENAPSNVKWWMEGRASEIGMIRSGETKAAPVVRKAVNNGRKYGKVEVQYTTAKWNQYAPYNDECPMVGRDEAGNTVAAVTGCVATAGAIVARYFEWPDAGVGTTEAYTYTSDDTKKSVTIPAFGLGRSYDWANMLLVYGANYTQAQGAAVAALMVDIGKASMMAYNYDAGSGTFDQNLLLGFQKHFKYNKQAYQASRDGYSDEEWIALVKNNLKNVGPMVYGGADDDGGHEFVFDGYTEDNYFSVNWGWGGEDNGWFLVDGLIIESMDWSFSQQQSSLFNLSPDKTGASNWTDQIVLTPFSDRYPGLYTTTKSFTQNTTFTMRASNYYNNATMPFTGNLYIAVYDKHDNWKENVSAAKAVSNMENAYISYVRNDYNASSFVESYWTNISCKITQPIRGGDRLRLRYEGQYSSGYARGDSDNCIWEIVISEDSGYSVEEIAAGSSFSYSKEGQINISTSLDGISFAMKDSSGKVCFSENVLTKNQVYEYDVKSLPKGVYTLEFRDTETYTLSLTL